MLDRAISQLDMNAVSRPHLACRRGVYAACNTLSILSDVETATLFRALPEHFTYLPRIAKAAGGLSTPRTSLWVNQLVDSSGVCVSQLQGRISKVTSRGPGHMFDHPDRQSCELPGRLREPWLRLGQQNDEKVPWWVDLQADSPLATRQ